MTRILPVHLVSDSTGETVSSIARSVISQFDGIDMEEHIWSLVRTRGQMEQALESIKKTGGLVLYTLVEPKLEEMLHETCQQAKIPCINVLARVMREVSEHLGMKVSAHPGRQYALDENYFDRMEAMNFAIRHDDGQATSSIREADIILVGASRTSKSPTSVYLAYRGYKVANVPFVHHIPLPEDLFEVKDALIVGLVISPERLVQIRKSRLMDLNEKRDTDYVDVEMVKEEMTEARKLFMKHGWPVIDVTRKSVEETAANILQVLNKYRENR